MMGCFVFRIGIQTTQYKIIIWLTKKIKVRNKVNEDVPHHYEVNLIDASL